MKYQNIRVGHFISRPNRFIAKIEIEGAEETVHVKNTGRCAELLVPGAEVYVQDSQQEAEDWLSDNEFLQGEMQVAVSSKSTNIGKKRKTRWDLIAVRKGDRLINMDSQIPNKIVKEWLEQEKWNHNLHNQSDRIHGITKIQPEYTYGKSRIDLYVEAQNRKVIYYTSGREQIVCTELFSSVCDSLLQHREFIQVHRSFLVNMNYIRSIGTMDMCLHNGTNVPLAQRRVADIKKHYLAFQMEE